MSDDALHRFIFESSAVRGQYVRLSETFQEIISQQNYPSFIKVLLGEALCSAALLAATIKFSGRLSVQFRGKGKLKFLLAQCDSQFNLRGLAKYDDDIKEEELIDAFKQGDLAILIDLGDGKKQYQGIVEWQGDSLSESIAGYFKHSEQLATQISLITGDRSAVGLLLQEMPQESQESDENFDQKWQNLIKNHPYQLRDMLELSPEQFLHKSFPDEDIRLFPEVALRFQCTCSRAKGEEAIAILGREEAEAELKARESLVVTCDFCNKDYIFDRIDVAKIFADKENQQPPDLH